MRLYLIARGAVDIEVRLGDARARRLATFNAGVMFGEMALIEGERRSADAFARGDRVVLYALASLRLQAILRENAELRRANEILKAASAFFAAELDRPHQRS